LTAKMNTLPSDSKELTAKMNNPSGMAPPANWESTETKAKLCKEKCLRGSCHNNEKHKEDCAKWCIGSDQRNTFSECINNESPAKWESTEDKAKLCKEKCLKGFCYHSEELRENCAEWCIDSYQINLFRECIKNEPPANWESTETKAKLCKEKCTRGSCHNNNVHKEDCSKWCIGSDQRDVFKKCIEEEKAILPSSAGSGTAKAPEVDMKKNDSEQISSSPISHPTSKGNVDAEKNQKLSHQDPHKTTSKTDMKEHKEQQGSGSLKKIEEEKAILPSSAGSGTAKAPEVDIKKSDSEQIASSPTSHPTSKGNIDAEKDQKLAHQDPHKTTLKTDMKEHKENQGSESPKKEGSTLEGVLTIIEYTSPEEVYKPSRAKSKIEPHLVSKQKMKNYPY